MMNTCRDAVGRVSPIELSDGAATANLGSLNCGMRTVKFVRLDGTWSVKEFAPTLSESQAACGSKEYEPFSAAINTYCVKVEKGPPGFCRAVQPALRTCVYQDFPLGRTAAAVVDSSLRSLSGEQYISFRIDGEGGDGRSWMVYFKECNETWAVSRVTVVKFEDGVGGTEDEYPSPVQCPQENE